MKSLQPIERKAGVSRYAKTHGFCVWGSNVDTPTGLTLTEPTIPRAIARNRRSTPANRRLCQTVTGPGCAPTPRGSFLAIVTSQCHREQSRTLIEFVFDVATEPPIRKATQ